MIDGSLFRIVVIIESIAIVDGSKNFTVSPDSRFSRCLRHGQRVLA